MYQTIEWLTGFNDTKIQELINSVVMCKTFFDKGLLNPNTGLIKDIICGYRVEEITTELTQKARYSDKIIDKLVRRKKIEKIMRTA
ncbi:DUF2200 domain-containing protein [Tenacibaculum sp. SZ-18]|uniref:DUF2200 domain-containing protein n=1 Tax=Tenacibaculum sp. SZ-18 TaxID=754423 RepID=UPI00214FC985|nr:DUF2200 domain-containing protein [Tenacibaculum sp. SZ-18]